VPHSDDVRQHSYSLVLVSRREGYSPVVPTTGGVDETLDLERGGGRCRCSAARRVWRRWWEQEGVVDGHDRQLDAGSTVGWRRRRLLRQGGGLFAEVQRCSPEGFPGRVYEPVGRDAGGPEERSPGDPGRHQER